MSFLIRRNLPLAWAGWYDTFDRAVENPIHQPWVHIGDGTTADLTTGQEMHIPSNYLSANAGGESYEWEPFTPNWGLEFRVWFPVEGLAAQPFSVFFTDSWAKIGPNKFEKSIGIRMLHEVGADGIQYGEWSDGFSIINNGQGWTSPIGRFKDQWATMTIWCENDEWFRIWCNGIYVGSKLCTPEYRMGPTRRCMRFLNTALCDAWVSNIDHFDRPASIPPKTVWSSIFYDDFDRSDGAAGNGWAQLGTDAGITSGRYVHSDANTNSVGLTRNVGNLNGRARMEAVVRNPSSTADSGLMLFMNAAGDQALTANVYSNHLYMGRLTSSVNGTPSFYDFQDLGVTIADGDKIAFSVYDGICWIEKNGTPVLYSGNVHDVVPATNQHAGLRVRREDTSNSAAFDDVRIYSGVGI